MRQLLLGLVFLGCANDPPTNPKPSIEASQIAPSTISVMSPATIAATSPATTRAVEVKPKIEPAQYVSAMESLSQVYQPEKDCATLSSELSAAVEVNKAAITGSTPEMMLSVDRDEVLRLKLRAAMSSLMSAAMKCQNEPAFQAVMKSLSPSGGL